MILPQVALTMVLFGIGAALPLILLGLLSRATHDARALAPDVGGKASARRLLGAAFIVIGVAIVERR